MLTRLKEEFGKHDVDITTIPITLDSWYVSEPLKQKLYGLGFTKIVVVGKSNYVFNDGSVKKTASMMEKRD
jgi:prepilin-type processing-associated H-X9-DG protein